MNDREDGGAARAAPATRDGAIRPPGPTERVSPIERTLAALEDVLLQELDRYRDLLDVLLEEKRRLTANEPESMSDLMEAQNLVLVDIRRLEPRRADAMRRMGETLGLEGTSTLRDVSRQLRGDARVRVEKLRAALAHVVFRVDRVNRINVLLIRNRMSVVSSTVRAILEESASPGRC